MVYNLPVNSPALAITALAISLSSLPLQSLRPQKPPWCRQLPRPAYRTLPRVAIRSSWFEVYRVRPGVFAIYEPHQSEEIISYLIVGNRRAVLFDTGMGIANIRDVVQSLTTLPVSVLNSHTHNDHVGDNWRFTDIYEMDTPFTRANAKGSIEDAQAEIAAGEICGELPREFNSSTYATQPFPISHWIHDREKLDLGGRMLEVIATPGHTPDSISLLDAENGLLFTGDTFYRGPIYLYRPETDLDAYVASLEKLVRLSPGLRLLLPAHNVPIAEPVYLSRVLKAIKQVRAGHRKPKPKKGKQEYRFTGFSFLMRD